MRARLVLRIQNSDPYGAPASNLMNFLTVLEGIHLFAPGAFLLSSDRDRTSALSALPDIIFWPNQSGGNRSNFESHLTVIVRYWPIGGIFSPTEARNPFLI